MNSEEVLNIYSKFQMNNKSKLSKRIIESFLKSLTFQNLIDLFWDRLDDPIVYKILKIQLQYYLNKTPEIIKEKLYKHVIEKLPEKRYIIEIKFRTILKNIYEILSDDEKYNIFFKFIKSKHAGNREFSYSIANSIYDKNIEELLKENWTNYHDISAVNTLYNQNTYSANDLMSLFDQYKDLDFFLIALNDDSISVKEHFSYINEIINSDVEDWIKRKCYKLMAENDISSIYFLKESDPLTFLYLMAINKSNVDDSFVIETIYKLTEVKQFSLLLWCVTIMKKSDLLIEIYDMVDIIEPKLNFDWDF